MELFFISTVGVFKHGIAVKKPATFWGLIMNFLGKLNHDSSVWVCPNVGELVWNINE